MTMAELELSVAKEREKEDTKYERKEIYLAA
jgi:hypothetical protein